MPHLKMAMDFSDISCHVSPILHHHCRAQYRLQSHFYRSNRKSHQTHRSHDRDPHHSTPCSKPTMLTTTDPELQTPSPMAIIIIIFILFLTISTTRASEEQLLLAFKSSISDPASSLSTWSPTTPLCSWAGVSCSNSPPSVTSLSLHSLNLSGELSPSICDLPRLSHLNLAANSFNQPIPLHLSRCAHLLTLNLSSNSLWGTLPDQLSLLSSLTILDLSGNRLEGQLPPSLGSLDSLQILNLAANLFTGALHPSLFANLTELVLLDLSMNPSLISELPAEVGKLRKLKWVFMRGSGLHGMIPNSLLGLHDLEFLDLSLNNLTGSIPLGFGLGLNKLVSLDLSENKLSGPFPADVCFGRALTELSLYGNSFTGSVAEGMGKCWSFQRFQVQDNEFSGDFPTGLWSLPEIRLVRAENNRFSGTLPGSVGSTSHLEQVQIDNNSFTGRIPGWIGLISTMYRFSASVNGFYGELPQNYCDSPVMSIVNLSHNALSGEIPELRSCKKLVSLSLAGNELTGGIPSSLARLPVLTYIDLSSNKLSGGIPQELQNLKLALFNVSFNQLSGSVPSSLISGLPASFLQGNPDLCGPGLPNPCNGRETRKEYQATGLILVIIVMASVVGFMSLAAIFFIVYHSSKRKCSSSSWKSVFFYPMRITEDELLMALDEKRAVGKGAFGNVYLVQLPGGELVAVKRLVNSSRISFRTVKAKIKMLTKARHNCLVKLLGFFHSDDVILLFHEYLQKGSLGDALCSSDFSMGWCTRFQIALGVAKGLAYLHGDCVPHLLHRNVKSNNILLDADLEPKITTFALDHIVGEASYQSSMASEMGFNCYMAPEQGCSKKATEQMDVYSYGVILLELISGRSAQQPDSKDGREAVDVVKWVRRKINVTNGSFQVPDPKISSSSQQEMLRVLELAILCTSVMPDKRPAMLEVVRILQSLVHPPRVLSSELFISD